MILNNSNNINDYDLSRDLQYRKELSIGYFNALNSAISVVGFRKKTTTSLENQLKEIAMIRDHFIAEYKAYRINTLNKISESKIPNDPVIINTLNELKQKYEDSSRSSTGN